MKAKKIISALLVFAMIISMASMVYALPDFDDTLDFTLEASDENYPGASGDGWTWDLATKMLTIDGLDLYTYGDSLILPDASVIVVTDDSVNAIVSEDMKGIMVYGDLTILGNGDLSVDAYDVAIRVTGNLVIEDLINFNASSEETALRVGPGKEKSITTLISEETPLEVEENYDGNLWITNTESVIIESDGSAINAVGSLVIDNVDTIEIIVNDSGSGTAGIKVGGGSSNYNQNDGDASITNVGILSVESYHTAIRVMGDLYMENVETTDIVSHYHTGIRVGRGDEEIDTDSLGNVDILNCGEFSIDANHTGIRVTGDLMIDTIDQLNIEARHIGIRAGKSYGYWDNEYSWSQSEAEGFVNIKNAKDVNINFGYAGVRSHSDIWIYNSMSVEFNQIINEYMTRSLDYGHINGYGLYASAGDITIEKSEVEVRANTFAIATGNVCKSSDYYYDDDYEYLSVPLNSTEYNFMDQMIGGDIVIRQSYVLAEISDVGYYIPAGISVINTAAIAVGNASPVDTTKRKIIIEKAKIVEPENGVVLDVDISLPVPMQIEIPDFYIDQSVTGNTGINLIESFEDMAQTVVIIPVYSITYDANTGTGTMVDLYSPYTPENEVEVMANTFVKVGYGFVGFNTAADGSGTDYQPGDIFNIFDDIVLYAQYDINVYIVTFKDWDDTLIETDSVEHGGSATAPSDPEREGYLFEGWDKSVDNIVENTTIKATYKLDVEYIEELVKKAEETKDQDDIDKAREWVLLLPEGEVKDDFDERLDAIQDLVDETPAPGDVYPLSSVIFLLLASAAIVVFATRKEKLING